MELPDVEEFADPAELAEAVALTVRGQPLDGPAKSARRKSGSGAKPPASPEATTSCLLPTTRRPRFFQESLQEGSPK